MPSDARLEALIQALRPDLDRLAVDLRPAPVHMPPLPWQSEDGISALVNLDPESQRKAIAMLLDSDEGVLQAVAVHVIIAGEHTELLDRAVDILRQDHPHDAFATMVVAAIGRLGAHRHKPALRSALDRPPTFWAAVESLALLGGDDVMEDLERAVARPADAWDRLDVITVIGHVGGEFAVPILAGILLDSGETFTPARGYAAQALGARGEQSALPALLEALSDPTMTEKGRVLWGITQLGTPDAFDAVYPYVLEAEKDWYRAEAIKAAASCDPQRAWEPLTELLDRDPYFRSDTEAFLDAVRALGSIRTPEARARLADLLAAVLDQPLPHDDWPLPELARAPGDRFLLAALEAVGYHLERELVLHETPRNISEGATLLLQRLAALPEADAAPFCEIARAALADRD